MWYYWLGFWKSTSDEQVCPPYNSSTQAEAGTHGEFKVRQALSQNALTSRNMKIHKLGVVAKPIIPTQEEGSWGKRVSFQRQPTWFHVVKLSQKQHVRISILKIINN